VPAGPKGPRPYLGGFGLAIASASKHKEEAWKFIVHAVAKESMLTEIRAGGQPARLSVAKIPEVAQISPYIIAIAQSLPYANFFPMIPQWGEVCAILGEEVSHAITKTKTPEQAMDDATKRAEKVFKDAGIYGKYSGGPGEQYIHLPE
jgi:multiple sugar transport system substrate-binding protein